MSGLLRREVTVGSHPSVQRNLNVWIRVRLLPNEYLGSRKEGDLSKDVEDSLSVPRFGDTCKEVGNSLGEGTGVSVSQSRK